MNGLYLLDTTVWIDLLRTNSPAIRRSLMKHSKSMIGLSVITLCELQYVLERRAARHPHVREREQGLLATMVAPFELFSLDTRVVESYGRVRAGLEESGKSIRALDT